MKRTRSNFEQSFTPNNLAGIQLLFATGISRIPATEVDSERFLNHRSAPEIPLLIYGVALHSESPLGVALDLRSRQATEKLALIYEIAVTP